MRQSIKKQMRVSLGDWGIGLGLTAGVAVFGLIFTRIMLVAGEIELTDATLLTVIFGAFGAGLFFGRVYGPFAADEFSSAGWDGMCEKRFYCFLLHNRGCRNLWYGEYA